MSLNLIAEEVTYKFDLEIDGDILIKLKSNTIFSR